MITQKDLDEIEQRLSDAFVTKGEFTTYKSELFDKLDEIVKNTSDRLDDHRVLAGQVRKHSDKILRLEKHLHLSPSI